MSDTMVRRPKVKATPRLGQIVTLSVEGGEWTSASFAEPNRHCYIASPTSVKISSTTYWGVEEIFAETSAVAVHWNRRILLIRLHQPFEVGITSRTGWLRARGQIASLGGPGDAY